MQGHHSRGASLVFRYRETTKSGKCSQRALLEKTRFLERLDNTVL